MLSAQPPRAVTVRICCADMNMLNRREALRSLARALAGGVAAAVAGCSGDSTTVVEGDPVARRKQKEDALQKALNPIGAPAPKGRGKGRPRGKVGPAEDLPGP
jgi:hypothetical protein